jgi:hypothetical protein
MPYRRIAVWGAISVDLALEAGSKPLYHLLAMIEA